MKKVSFIVPVYNTSRYLKRCIESVLSQTYENIEIILVDDESLDDSLNICRHYQKLYCNIIVISKRHSGLSETRNYGIKRATGEFMAFLDSDDWIEPHFTKILVHNMITYKAQISSCNSRSVSSEDEAYALCNEHISAPEVYNPLEYLNLVYTNNNVNVLICNKIYHKSLFDKVVFPVGELYEDVITNFLLCINSVRIVHTHTHLFNYFTSSTGITRSPLKEQDFQLINQWNRVLQLSKELSPELYNTIFARKITAYRALANKYMKYGTTDKKLAIKIKKLFLYELKKIIVCTKIPRSKKLHSIVAAFSIRLYYKFRHYGHG